MNSNRYAPPSGYALDTSSGLYYMETQTKDGETGQPVRLVTWFDPATGSSQQASYLMEPKACRDASPARPEQQAEVKNAVPAGFVPYPGTDYYYQSTQGIDHKTGLPADLVTFFDPQTGEYHEVAYPKQQKPDAPIKPVSPVIAPKPAPPPPSSTLLQNPYSSWISGGQENPPPAPIADGFLEDAATGQFYRASLAGDSWELVWYDPQTQQYTEDVFPTVLSAAATKSKSTAPSKGKNRVLPICLTLFLILGMGTGIWLLKPFPFQRETAPTDTSAPATSSNAAKPPSSESKASSSQPTSSDSSDVSSSQPTESIVPDAPNASNGALEFGTPMNKIFPEDWKEASFEELQSILQESVDKGDFNALDMDSLPGFFLSIDTPSDAEMPGDPLDAYTLFAPETDQSGQAYSPEQRPTLAIYSRMIFFFLVAQEDEMRVLIGEYTVSGSFEDGTTQVTLTAIDDSLQQLTGQAGNEILLSLGERGWILETPQLGLSAPGEELIMQ